jgi:hypothetical protein
MGKLILQTGRHIAGLGLLLAPLVAFAQTINPYQNPQVTAEPPPRVPATASCTETVLTYTFYNSYYAPGFGQHLASKCPGPWSAVILTVSVSTSSVQYDRLLDVYAGPVLLLSSSTSEPASEIPGVTTSWSVSTDVSRFAALLASNQPVTTILNNVYDSTYDGAYAVTETLTFYATGPTAPAATVPDVIQPVFPQDPGSPGVPAPSQYGGDSYAWLSSPTQAYQQNVTLPRNLLSLQADLYAQGHGACEEFWWAEPNQCGIGTPLRQVVLSIDGVIAGLAPVYPTVFTGGGGPGLWEPIPSPRAWHLYPYVVDLTPFVGTLVDGKPHQFALSIPDAAYESGGDDYWLVGATLLGTVDHGAAQTSGALTSPPVAASATESLTDPLGDGDAFTATRSAEWTGYVIGSAGTTTTDITNTFTMQSEGAPLAASSAWSWTTASTVTVGNAAPVTTTVAYTYGLTTPNVEAGGNYSDAETTTVSSSGSTSYSFSYDLNLSTVGAGPAVNASDTETYQATDSTGYCYHAMVSGAAGYVASNQSGLPCTSEVTLPVVPVPLPPLPSPPPAPLPLPPSVAGPYNYVVCGSWNWLLGAPPATLGCTSPSWENPGCDLVDTVSTTLPPELGCPANTKPVRMNRVGEPLPGA